MTIRLCARLALAALLMLPVGAHAEDTPSLGLQFKFAWSVEERALAKEALSRLPTDLLRIDRVLAKMDDMTFELTVPDAITLGLALSRYYDRDAPERNAIAQGLFAQLGGRSTTRSPVPFGRDDVTDGSSAFSSGSAEYAQSQSSLTPTALTENRATRNARTWNGRSRTMRTAQWLGDQAHASAPVTYYFSPFGRDNHNCRTPSTACQTIAKVNRTTFNPGDQILFQGGQTFTGCLVFSYASNVPVSVPSNPIVIGSYGTGNATILSDCPGANTGGSGPKSRAVDLNGVSATVQDLVISANGTKTQFGIVVQNGAGGTTSNVTIQRNRIYGFYSDVTQDSGNEIFVVGFSFSGVCGALDHINILNNTLGDPSSATSNDQTGVGGYGCGTPPNFNITNVTAQGNIFQNMGGSNTYFAKAGNGIVPNQWRHGLIQFNVARDIGANAGTCGGGGGMWAYFSDDITFQFNEAYNIQPLPISGPGHGACDWNGFGFDGGVSNSLIQYVYSHHNGGSGIYTCVGCGTGAATTYWGPNTIRYSITENNNSIGNGFQGELGLGNKGNGLGTVYIYNITVYSNLSFTSGNLVAPCISVNQGSFASGILANVLCVMAGVNQYGQTAFYFDNHQGAAGLTILNNAYYKAGGTPVWTWQGNPYTSIPAWVSASGVLLDETGSLTSNPLLANPGSGGTCSMRSGTPEGRQSCPAAYALSAGSPMIGVGLDLTAPPYNLSVGMRDFYGNGIPHTVGSGYNIGADGATH
jgi:hypothetical protein